MEPLSIASFTLASVLSTLSTTDEQTSQAMITTHISPAIAGQWEIDLSDAHQAVAAQESRGEASHESVQTDGVVDNSARRITRSAGSNMPAEVQTSTSGSKPMMQCREIYNFEADNAMRSVSGKEWTYGRYLVTHRDEGLPLIVIKTIYDNNEVDCSGNQVDQSDETMIAYLKYDDTNMQWCADPEGKECFMSFHRILP